MPQRPVRCQPGVLCDRARRAGATKNIEIFSKARNPTILAGAGFWPRFLYWNNSKEK
jgi:hypothetical protein